MIRSAPTSSVSASRDSGSREADISSRPSPTRRGVVKYQTLVLLADWLCRISAPTVRYSPGRASSSHR